MSESGSQLPTYQSPFDPPGVLWQQVDPVLIKVRLVGAALGMLPVLAGIALAAFASGQTWLWIVLAVVAVLVLWRLILIPRMVRAIGYVERADDLLIRKGLLFRNLTVVPYGRMQYVDVTAGPIARHFKIAAVQLHTAAVGTDASIPGLPEAEANRLRDQLASRGQARLAGL